MRCNLPWSSRNAIAMGAVALAVGALAACSGGGSSSPSAGASAPADTGPITIGASLSLHGGFTADGVAFEKGYKLWAKDVNAHGGILGRQVELTILDNKSSPNQVVTDYQTLINHDHVDLTFGPFTSLLTAAAASVAAHNGYAFIEGAGGAPSVFDAASNQADHNTFDVSLPVEDTIMPFVNYIAKLPLSQRERLTAAYPMAQDPFAIPPVQLAEQKLHALGVQTKSSAIANLHRSALVLPAGGGRGGGSAPGYRGARLHRRADRPGVHEGVRAEELHAEDVHRRVRPGPGRRVHLRGRRGQRRRDDGAQRLVPRFQQRGQQGDGQRVREAVRRVSASGVNADVAEAYSVGQVAAAAIKATGGTDNTKIIQYLHSGVTLQSVQGPVQFNSLGENVAAAAFVFQWQDNGTKFVQVLPQG